MFDGESFDISFLSCGHAQICGTCALKFNREDRCPTCRCCITSKLQIFQRELTIILYTNAYVGILVTLHCAVFKFTSHFAQCYSVFHYLTIVDIVSTMIF